MAGNLLVILSDEHQARILGAAGHGFIRTPHLDGLASLGMRFTNAYTPCPICVPARAAFASGRHVHQTGHWDNAMPYAGTPKGWGHHLQDAGIRVESIGKLHYRHQDDEAGFDVEHIPMMVKDGVGMVWASIRREGIRQLGANRMLGDYIGPGTSPYTDYDGEITKRTIAWLEEASGRKQGWCLYVGLVAPHFPLVVPEEFYGMYATVTFPDAKLHPDSGYQRHPWVEKQNAFMDTEAKFRNAEERHRAFVAYHGLVSWLDHNVGQILEKLHGTGLANNTTVIYSSDHGDNVGARGLWGKSNMYEEAAAVPLIMAGPDIPQGCCSTPVSLLDATTSILQHFGLPVPDEMQGEPLQALCRREHDPERVVFSEYHAAGAVSGAFMIRKGRHKLIHYVGFEPELFDLEADPDETVNLADRRDMRAVREELHSALADICDPDEVDSRAHADQAAMVERFGGLEAAKKLGAAGATPPPELSKCSSPA